MSAGRSTQPLRDAIAVYDAGQASRDAAWDDVVNDKEVWEAGEADRAAIVLVQQAFYEATSHINSRASAAMCDIRFMRKVSELVEL